MFGWWRQWQRKRLLAKPFPAEWEPWLIRNCRHYPRLDAVRQQRLRNDVRMLVAEKHWEGCNGLVVTDEMRVTIAAHAAVMGLGFPASPFDRLLSVLIYPDTFVSQQPRQKPWGVVDETAEPRLGEAWYHGPVLLAWREIVEQCIGSPGGRNVIVHEFAHLLDMANQDVDGIPDLDGVTPQPWVQVFRDSYQRLVRQAQLGRRTVLDYYGATSKPEFFAVSSEAFFEQPQALHAEIPALYDVLREYYRQDPAAWPPVGLP